MRQRVSRARIETNWDLNPRAKNDDFIDDLASIMREKGYDPYKRLTIFKIPGYALYQLACGHHRYEAAGKAGIDEIYCEIIEGTLSDLIEKMCADNIKFDPTGNAELGQLWTSKEKREAGKLLLLIPKYFAMSDRELTPIFGVDHHSTVGRWRADVVSVAIAPPDNPQNIEEPRLAELRELVSQRTEQNKHRSAAQSKKRAIAKLYEDRKAFQATIQNFVALPSLGYINFTYCRRRVVALIGLEDAGDSAEWELEKIETQAKIAADAVAVINKFTHNADVTDIEDGSLKELLYEIKLIGSANERYSVLKPPQLPKPLDARTPTALKNLEHISTTAWETLPATNRRSYLIKLLNLQPVLYASECDKRSEAAVPSQPAECPVVPCGDPEAIAVASEKLNRAREATKAAASELNQVWSAADFDCTYAEFLAFVSKAYDFDLETLRAICFTMSVRDGIGKFNAISLGELGTWQKRLNALKDAIQRGEAVLEEIREPKADTSSTHEGTPVVKSEKLDLLQQMDAEIPKWKQRHEGVAAADTRILLEATWKMLHTNEFPKGAAPCVEHLKFLLMYMTDDDTGFVEQVRQRLNPKDAAKSETPDWRRIETLLSDLSEALKPIEVGNTDQVEEEIHGILARWIGGSTDLKLAVIAKMMLSIMQERDHQP